MKIGDDIKKYKKNNVLNAKYYSLLDNIGKFINEYEIDISSVNKSIISKINNHCKIHSITKACFSEPEDEENTSDEYKQNTSDENNETSNVQNISLRRDNYEDDYINKLCNVLLKAIEDNHGELMICTMNYLNKIKHNS